MNASSLNSSNRGTTVDDLIVQYYQTKAAHPRLARHLEGHDDALIQEGLNLRDRLITRLGGTPRLERDVAPLNAESNDLYQFRMASVFFEESPEKRGTYILYYRKPTDIGGAVAAGVDRALDTIEHFKLDPRFLQKLLTEEKITPGLYAALLQLDHLDVVVDAVPEGTFVGPNTPLLTVTGPLWQVQLLETVLLQCTDYATGVATRAAAIVEASGGKPLIDFGTRRAPGEEAAITSAFSSVKGGAGAVANTLASYLSHRIPGEEPIEDTGTTAHAYTESYFLFDEEGNALEDPAESEQKAYGTWIKYFPKSTCVLIDTVDKKVGLKTAAHIYEKMGLRAKGKKIAVRDDSAISPESILFMHDELRGNGVEDFTLVVTDNLTPDKIRTLREAVVAERGAAFWETLDIRFGVGTYMARPEPTGLVFKLAEHNEGGRINPVAKRSGSPEKASFSRTTTYRVTDETGRIVEDVNLAPHEDPASVVEGTHHRIQALAREAFSNGVRLVGREAAKSVQARWNDQVGKLPEGVFGKPFTVHKPHFSAALEAVRANLQRCLAEAA